MLECRTATDHGASLITASDNGNVVCSVSWIKFKMAVTLDIRFTVSIFFANHQPGSDVLIHVAPSSVFSEIKFVMSLVAYAVYVYQKLVNFIDAFNCKLSPFNLAQPV